MSRVHLQQRLWRLDWPTFESAAAALSEPLGESSPDAIIAIARGGLPLGRLLARTLHAPLITVVARANTSDTIRSPPVARVHLDASELDHCAAFQRPVICDDIAGSGATLLAVTAAVAAVQPHASLRSATLCRNAGAEPAPDLWVWTVYDWVLFPWEPRTAQWQEAKALPGPAEVQRRT